MDRQGSRTRSKVGRIASLARTDKTRINKPGQPGQPGQSQDRARTEPGQIGQLERPGRPGRPGQLGVVNFGGVVGIFIVRAKKFRVYIFNVGKYVQNGPNGSVVFTHTDGG